MRHFGGASFDEMQEAKHPVRTLPPCGGLVSFAQNDRIDGNHSPRRFRSHRCLWRAIRGRPEETWTSVRTFQRLRIAAFLVSLNSRLPTQASQFSWIRFPLPKVLKYRKIIRLACNAYSPRVSRGTDPGRTARRHAKSKFCLYDSELHLDMDDVATRKNFPDEVIDLHSTAQISRLPAFGSSPGFRFWLVLRRI